MNDGNSEPAPLSADAADPARPLRAAPSRDRIEEWSLVLAATGIDHQIARSTEGDYLLFVPESERSRAARSLALYDEETRLAARRAPDAPERGGVGLGIVVGLALIAFAYRTGFWETSGASRWFEVGVADAARIRSGDWWRAVTAMTLHGDLMHLLGNVAASVIFMGAAGRWLGSGVAAMLIVLAGAAANVLTAWTERPEHLSAGASTATFAALGLVVGLQIIRRWRGGGAIRRRAWIAAGAGLALLAMLGVSAKADVFAHAFGLGVGTLLGAAAGILDRPAAPGASDGGPPPVVAPTGRTLSARTLAARAGNVALGLAAAAAVVAAWTRALAGR